jgi:hypothetical protein
LIVRDGGEGITFTGEASLSFRASVSVGGDGSCRVSLPFGVGDDGSGCCDASLSFGDDGMTIAELLAQYEEMAVAELLVDQKEWQVHGPWVTTSVFDLTIYVASVVISAHLRKFCDGSTI